MASSRLYVQEGIYEKLVKKLVEKAKTWVVGDPFDPQVRQGPQVTKIKGGWDLSPCFIDQPIYIYIYRQSIAELDNVTCFKPFYFQYIVTFKNTDKSLYNFTWGFAGWQGAVW